MTDSARKDDQVLLSVRDLRVSFQLHGTNIEAVRGVSFDIRRGETVALVGESGSGKSVTAQAIMGILPRIGQIDGGQVLFSKTPGAAVDIAKLSPQSDAMRDIRGGDIAMIFQEPMVSLSPLHTLGDQISEALLLHRPTDKKSGLALTEDMLRMVGFPDPKRALTTYPFELSGGLRQRAMIAMALVCHPVLLIADEPTTALDVTIQAQILKLISDLQQELHMAVMIITHDLGVVANVAERVVVMYHGEIMESGSVQALFSEPQHPYLKALHRAVPHFDMVDGERLVPIRDIKYELGSMAAERMKWPEAAKATPHLSVRGLTKHFRIRNNGWFHSQSSLVKAVDNVSFDVSAGECFGLVGESGCGKTTLSKMLMRVLQPDAGEMIYNDRGTKVDLLQLQDTALTKFRTKMQFIFQDPFSSLNPRMTVFDIIREPLIIHDPDNAEEHGDYIKELIRLVGLDPRFLNRYPHSFSGGQRQRIGIARALALKPDFIICDEPVSALDVSIQAQILNLLKDLQKELHLTYIFISHNLAVVDYMAERIAVMCKGILVEIAQRESIFRNPRHPYTKALLAAVPFPDLDRRLDFTAVLSTGYSDPGAWPDGYRIGTELPPLQEIESGHFVRGQA